MEFRTSFEHIQKKKKNVTAISHIYAHISSQGVKSKNRNPKNSTRVERYIPKMLE